MNIEDKPKLKTKDLINKMRDEKGITFNHTTEDDAIHFLKYHNNYTRTCSYRKNFQKHNLGENKGKYINLDFAHLKELSILDMELRFLIIKICSDIEHSLKVKLIYDIESDDSEDGYSIVNKFLSENTNILQRINLHKSSYVKQLIMKYFTFDSDNKIKKFDDCPIWILTEILTFGDFINLYEFYYKNNNTDNTYIQRSTLNLIKSLRNSAAHNNCILCNLNISKNVKPTPVLSKIFSQIPSINTKKLKSRLILELSTLIYVYSITVDDGSRKHRIKEINEFFFTRLEKNKELFIGNALLTSSSIFIKEVIKYHLVSD